MGIPERKPGTKLYTVITNTSAVFEHLTIIGLYANYISCENKKGKNIKFFGSFTVIEE